MSMRATISILRRDIGIVGRKSRHWNCWKGWRLFYRGSIESYELNQFFFHLPILICLQLHSLIIYRDLLRENPFEPDGDHVVGEFPLSRVKGDGLSASLLDVTLEMILQILAHPGQVKNGVDADLFQTIRISDSTVNHKIIVYKISAKFFNIFISTISFIININAISLK